MSVLLNILLFIIKFIAGKISGSVSITADAFNNLTDAGTVLFTSVGIRISSIGPGKNHPEGHGKFEWVFALITSFSVLLVGWELLKDSIYSIGHPTDTVFSWITFIILVVSICIKVFLYIVNLSNSKKKNSLSLKAVAIDSLSDAFSTMAVLISLLLNTFFGWKLDGFFGLIVSVLIMYNALKSAGESISRIIGTAAPKEKLEELSNVIKSFFREDVPVIDLEILDNGYNRYKVSLHLVSTEHVLPDEILRTVPLIQKTIKEKYDYDSIIQVEEAADKDICNKIIAGTKEQLLKAGFSFPLSDERVLLCNDNTYQLVSNIKVPWLDKDKLNELSKMIQSSEQLGLDEKTSAQIKMVLCGHDEKRCKGMRQRNKENS